MQIGRTVEVTNFGVTDIEGTEWGWTELIGGPTELRLDDDVLGEEGCSRGGQKLEEEMAKKITCKEEKKTA